MTVVFPIDYFAETSAYINFYPNLIELMANEGHNVIVYIATKVGEGVIEKIRHNKKLNNVRIVEHGNMNIKNADYITEKIKSLNFSWIVWHPIWERWINWRKFLPTKSLSQQSTTWRYIIEIDELFNAYNPDIVIAEPPSTLILYVFYWLSSYYSKKYIGIISSRIPGKVDLWDRMFTNSQYERIYSDYISMEEIDLYSSIANDFALERLRLSYGKLPHVEVLDKLISHYRKYINIVPRWIIKLLCNKRKILETYDYVSIATLKKFLLLSNVFYNLRRKRNVLRLQKSFFKYPKFVNNEKFYIFPLHYQPEASTSVQSPFYCDLYSTTRYISFSLPFPYKLYVKEHPHAVGIRGKKFFKEISKLPNVEIIHPEADNVKLIENSEGVITLTSTLGLQAALLGKPVYVLGKVFYDFHPNVKKVNSIDELHYVLNHEPLEPLTGDKLKEANARFMKAYYLASANVDLINLENNSEENYKDLLKKILILISKK